MPILVNGRTLGRAPGEQGGDVIVAHMKPGGTRYSYDQVSVETYSQFTNAESWMVTQRKLFGRDWDHGDESTLHD